MYSAIPSNRMSSQPTQWVARAAIKVLQNVANVPTNVWINSFIDPSKIPIVWDSGAPEGRSGDFLNATFPAGYQVSYNVEYSFYGYIYLDTGAVQFVEHTTDLFTGEVAPPNTLSTTTNSGLYYYWKYGIDGFPTFTVPIGRVPKQIIYMFQRSGINYVPHDVSWIITYTITVVRDCTVDNVPAQICQVACLGSLSQECYINYSEYCLKGEPDKIATQPCTAFWTKWIQNNGGDPNVDAQARKYCSKRYRGFNDLLEGTNPPTIPEEERLQDIQICACNLVDTELGAVDPIGTVLYNNYFNSIVAQFPGFAIYGASIQQKCLVPACASSNFKPAGVGPGGCKVPQCINLIDITNDGTVTGSIVATASCESTAAGTGTVTNIFTTVIIVLVVLLILFILVYFFTTPGEHRFDVARHNAIVRQAG